MKRSKIVLAITMALNTGALVCATSQAQADELVALNMQPESAMTRAVQVKTTPKNMTGDELLARGMARLSTARNPQDFRAAYHFLEVASNKGVAEAQFQLALMQLDNEYVSRDEETAIRWLKAAIAQGHQQASVALDYVLYEFGDIGC